MRARPGQAAATLTELLGHDTDECVLWPFGVNGKGYPQIGDAGRSRSVHVIVCERFHGPRPEGFHAAHWCGVKRCVNRRHLRWVTPTENESDKAVHRVLARLRRVS